MSRTAKAAVAAVLAAALLAGCTGPGASTDGRARRAPAPPASVAPSPEAPSPGDAPPDGATPPSAPRELYVAAGAAPGGDGSVRRPFATIQQGLDAAWAGDTVRVGPGTYREELRSRRSGTSDSPIRVVGNGAVVTGTALDDGRLVELYHDYLVLEGLELTGSDKLVWMVGTTGVRLVGNWLHGAGGECVRLRYHARGNEIAGNRIEDCGRVNFDLERNRKNGEAVYIGTAPEQLDRNPTGEPDDSGRNWVHDNVMNTRAECVDVKEDSRGNVIERNMCTGGLDPEGAGFSSRGLATVIRENVSIGHAGSGVRVGGDDDDDGVLSTIVGNVVTSNGEYGVEVHAEPQRALCGNVSVGNRDADSNGGEWDVTAACPATTGG